MTTFQVYRVETSFVTVVKAEGLTAYRLTSFVFKTLGFKGGDEAGHREDARRYPEAASLLQKYHPFSSHNASKNQFMAEADAQVLAAACGWSVEELVRRAAEHWDLIAQGAA